MCHYLVSYVSDYRHLINFSWCYKVVQFTLLHPDKIIFLTPMLSLAEFGVVATFYTSGLARALAEPHARAPHAPHAHAPLRPWGAFENVMSLHRQEVPLSYKAADSVTFQSDSSG